ERAKPVPGRDADDWARAFLTSERGAMAGGLQRLSQRRRLRLGACAAARRCPVGFQHAGTTRLGARRGQTLPQSAPAKPPRRHGGQLVEVWVYSLYSSPSRATTGSAHRKRTELSGAVTASCDVVVLGGGPAGSAVATALARRRRRV